MKSRRGESSDGLGVASPGKPSLKVKPRYLTLVDQGSRILPIRNYGAMSYALKIAPRRSSRRSRLPSMLVYPPPIGPLNVCRAGEVCTKHSCVQIVSQDGVSSANNDSRIPGSFGSVKDAQRLLTWLTGQSEVRFEQLYHVQLLSLLLR